MEYPGCIPNEKELTLGSRHLGLILPEEMKELIMNSGTFKDGKAGVSIRGQFKSLDELSGEDYEALKNGTKTLADLKEHFWNHQRDCSVLGL